MASKIQLRRDTVSNWASVNPILSQGEIGYEIGTGKIKIGNGVNTWTQLPYYAGEFTVLPADATGYLRNDGEGTLSWDNPEVGDNLPADAVGFLQNDGEGNLTWSEISIPAVGEFDFTGTTITIDQASESSNIEIKAKSRIDLFPDQTLENDQYLKIAATEGAGPAPETFTITNDGANAYVVNGESGGTLNLSRGGTYTLNISAAGHPFWIQSEAGAYGLDKVYNDGVTNNGAATGTITFVVPLNAPDTLYYVCQLHSSMAGEISITGTGNRKEISIQPGGTSDDSSADLVLGHQRVSVKASDIDKAVTITTNNGPVVTNKWIFNQDGTVTFPDGTSQETAYQGTGFGKTWFVALNGDDDNPGNIPEKSFRTIKHALTQAEAGDIVLVAAGTFVEAMPLTVPAGVSVRGSGIRATHIKPLPNARTVDGFLLNGETHLSDFLISDLLWNDDIQAGYAFRIADQAVFTFRSPYLERITVLNRGSVTTLRDPYGFNQGDAGRGLLIDPGVMSTGSIESAMLLNEMTFIVPNSVGMKMTNGARAESLNSFVYFADKAVLAVTDTTGPAGQGKTRLRLSGYLGGAIQPGYTLYYTDAEDNTIAAGPIEDFNEEANDLITLGGYIPGFVESSITDPVQNISIRDGSDVIGTATHTTFVDYKDFGAELRAIACAHVYGNYGIHADGPGIELSIMSHNFAYTGVGADLSNDRSLVIHENEVVTLNGAKVFHNYIREDGTFQIGLHNAEWEFNPNGGLRFPDGTVQTEAYRGPGATTGSIIPEQDNQFDLGSPEKQWRHLYVANGSIYIGDVKLSNVGGKLSATQVTDPGTELEAPVTVDGDALIAKGVEADATVTITVNGDDSTQKAWQFNQAGNLVLPEGGDIKDNLGNSVLGGATNIANTIKGFINLVGNKPNNDDEVAFESVAVQGDYAYVASMDSLVTDSNNQTKIYKFDLRTGEQVWVKQIVAGRNASFDFSISSEVISITNIADPGEYYKAGEELYFYGWRWNGNDFANRVTVIVDTVDANGGILTASIKPGYNLTGIGDQTQTGQTSDNNGARGDVASIAYDTLNNALVVVSKYESGEGDVTFDNYYTWTNVYVLNPTTGVVISTATLSTDGDIFANSITTTGNEGEVAIVGEKYGEFRQFGTLSLLAGFSGYFDVLKSEIDAEHYPGSPYDWYGDFWVSGTGINTVENVDNVNSYENLSAVTREGSGATFDILKSGGNYTVIGADGGTNYRDGHKVKILGTDLGGVTPDNDLILTVVTNGSGAVIGTDTGEGVATSGTETYSGVTGINYNVGSGALIAIGVDPVTGAFVYNGFSNTGSNYVAGDVLTVSGTNFANGSSPTNNATFVVGSVSLSGGIDSIVNGAISGAAPTDALRIIVNGVDFSVSGGSWSMKQNLGGEAFVWTPFWTNAIGGPSGDRFYDVCYSSDGSSIYAVGRGRYETNYDQALVVKFNATTGAVIWGKDIRFEEAAQNNREARAVCQVSGSSDIIVAGGWGNPNTFESELIITRMTDAGAAVWQKTYTWNNNGSALYVDYEIKLSNLGNNIVVSMNMGTPEHSGGLGYLIIDANGAVVDTRVLSADGNSNYNYYNTPTPNFADIYTDANDVDYIVMAGYTYVPTDNYYNALLFKLPLDGYKLLNEGEYVSLGEHILGKYNWDVTTVTSAFDSFTATEHVDTIVLLGGERNYQTITPTAELPVFKFDITDDSAGYLEFGDGSKQSFATNIVPQIPAANAYYLTEQDSGKHIFFESESGRVYIPHWQVKNLPVGFTVTVINTTGNDCYIECQDNPAGDGIQGRLKLAGRNIQTSQIGIPDSGSGSMVTLVKVKSGYSMLNTDADTVYPDIWMVSGPGDLYDSF